jgi:hypothetical protein
MDTCYSPDGEVSYTDLIIYQNQRILDFKNKIETIKFKGIREELTAIWKDINYYHYLIKTSKSITYSPVDLNLDVTDDSNLRLYADAEACLVEQLVFQFNQLYTMK